MAHILIHFRFETLATTCGGSRETSVMSVDQILHSFIVYDMITLAGAAAAANFFMDYIQMFIETCMYMRDVQVPTTAKVGMAAMVILDIPIGFHGGDYVHGGYVSRVAVYSKILQALEIIYL